tara:strand:- start:258499 stop:259539 length:1041 start_codon:yes stop_codon:yes gene_type:complete
MPQLDALRALAVASVAYSHWVPSKLHFGLPWGPGGVQLFFVLSGFLITGILLRCRDFDAPAHAMKAFYARRFLRIFPLFYVVVFFAFVFAIESMRESVWWHVAYLSNLYFVVSGGWDGRISHFWSLAVEEQFYLLWPAVVLLVPFRYLKGSAITLCVIGIFSRFILPSLLPDVALLSVLPNSNFDALGLGAIIAMRSRDMIHFPVEKSVILAVPLYMAFVFGRAIDFEIPFHRALERTMLLLIFMWLIEASAIGFGGMVGRILENRVLLYLGRISYGLYILHNFAQLVVPPLDSLAWLGGFAEVIRVVLMALLTVSVATCSWYVMESPLNSLKRLFPYRPQTLATA